VLRWLAGVPRAEADVLAGCQAALGGSVLAPELLVLLGWLEHAASCVTRSQQMAANPVWNRRNVRVVVQGAADLLGTPQAAPPVPATRAAR
jgi:hypothetical protein